MRKLFLLFTKDGLQAQITKGKSVLEEDIYHKEDEGVVDFVSKKLEILLTKDFSQIEVVSALNQFAMMPAGFMKHDLGFDLIGYNARVNPEGSELMLSVNKKYNVQFYYLFPETFYQQIKAVKKPTKFNFSGEKFLGILNSKGKKEIHIHLLQNQCEFIALEQKKVILYNNLDVNSEVDFLYFIMFTLNKIGFGIKETYFYVYGETSENETFISELQKFVNHLKIIFDNTPKKLLVLN